MLITSKNAILLLAEIGMMPAPARIFGFCNARKLKGIANALVRKNTVDNNWSPLNESLLLRKMVRQSAT